MRIELDAVGAGVSKPIWIVGRRRYFEHRRREYAIDRRSSARCPRRRVNDTWQDREGTDFSIGADKTNIILWVCVGRMELRCNECAAPDPHRCRQSDLEGTMTEMELNGDVAGVICPHLLHLAPGFSRLKRMGVRHVTEEA